MSRPAPFAGDDPFALTRAWMDEAAQSEPSDPNAIQLATVNSDGLPNVRTVLIKEIEADGFVFYTNYTSAKGQEIAQTGQAAFVMYWKSLGRQVRARGPVEQVSATQSDAYYATRPVQSRIGAWASDQSQPLADRETLAAKVETLTAEMGEAPARPPHWGGFRITPIEMEFWADGAFRLHDRFRWTRAGAGAPWSVTRLYP